MRLAITWGELARAAGGRLLRGAAGDSLDSISTDSRRLREGEAFLALRGERHDAHAFLDEALAARAGGWIVAESWLARGGPLPARLVAVADTLKALQALAAFHRRRFDLPVAAVAGSNGKTTTKEMLASICARLGPVCASPGNWNNEVGVPLSLLELGPEHRFGVFELAARRRGEIAALARAAAPTVGVLTNVGPDHLETFGSVENSFLANAELLEALPPDGRVALNADDPWLSGLEPRLGERAVLYGTRPGCLVRLEGDGLVVDRHRVPLRLRSYGLHSLYNAAAAAAAAWAMGASPEAIRLGLEDHRPGGLRQEVRELPGDRLLVVDAYNANPASMRASVEAFCERWAARPRTLVLGDMKELGGESARYHRELGDWLAGLPLKSVWLAGPEAAETAAALRARRPSFPVAHEASPGALAAPLAGGLAAGDAVLFKASRAMRLEELARAVENAAAAAGAPGGC